MPPEIADSDAESDLGSPNRPAFVSETRHQDIHPQPSPSSIDFDQFLDQTQRLSSSASHQTSGVSQLDGVGDINTRKSINGASASTDLTSISTEMSPAVKTKKRALSALQDSSKDALTESSDNKSKTKRSKTYGAASKSRSSLGDDLFMPSLAPLPEDERSVSTDPDASTTEDTAVEVQAAFTESNMLSAASPSDQTEATSTFGRSLNESTPLMTTSLASMGQYQSINLDFRGGHDVNANPFGSMSQLSLEGEPDQAGIEHLANVLGAPEEQSQQPNENLLDFAIPIDQPLPATSQSSPVRPLALDPAQLVHHPQELDTAADIADTALPTTEKPPPKKRGRKAKNSTLSTKSRAPSLSEDADEHALSIMPPPSRSRLGTVDSVSQASEASGPVSSTKKRKRGKSKQVVEEVPTNPVESSQVKQSNGELNLSDENIIGLPKEAYKPRPSRSRSKNIVEEEEPQPEAVESSPVKPPSSPANLSDEATIGLPKENYKPRPSRFRSKKVAEEAVPELPPPEPELDPRTPAKSIVIDVAEETIPTVPSTKSSTKKGRKSKVKRAKTSAAALLRKTDPMLSEGEEDVVWMETKPAPVKLDLPPDLKALKKEVDRPEEEDEDEVVTRKRTTKSDNITIEVPVNTDRKTPVAEPKKRGRKPKKVQQKSEEKIVDEDDEEEPKEANATSRPALAEKSANIPTTSESPAGQKPKKTPTVSPLTSPEPEVGQQQKLPRSPAKTKETRPLATPAKAKPTVPPSSAEKGPTKHSPITTSGKKFLYRVGLSRRQTIPSLLRKVDREKKAVKNVAIKQKERKVKMDDDDEEGGGKDPGEMRGADGMLVEWEF